MKVKYIQLQYTNLQIFSCQCLIRYIARTLYQITQAHRIWNKWCLSACNLGASIYLYEENKPELFMHVCCLQRVEGLAVTGRSMCRIRMKTGEYILLRNWNIFFFFPFNAWVCSPNHNMHHLHSNNPLASSYHFVVMFPNAYAKFSSDVKSIFRFLHPGIIL